MQSLNIKKTGFIIFCIIIFLIALFEGVVAYTVPVRLSESISFTQLGFVLAFSSITGAIFDFVFSKYFPNFNFRRLFLYLILTASVFLAVFTKANNIVTYLIAMGLWGIYYDLFMFSKADYIAHNSNETSRTKNWGRVNILYSLGYILAPVLASILLLQTNNAFLIIMASILLIALSLILILRTKHKESVQSIAIVSKKVNVSFKQEFISWKRIIKILFPVFLFVFYLTLLNAVFWTAGPIYSEEMANEGYIGSLFMFVYALPTLFAGLLAHKLSKRFGKKRTAFLMIFLLSLLLIVFSLAEIFSLRLILIFFISCFEVIAFILINATLTDYVAESNEVENEIVAVNDFFTNIGYIVGPIFAGLLLDMVGISWLYGFLGVITIIFIVIVAKMTPREINIKSSDILN